MRNDDRILVFLSRPNPYLDNQQLFIDKLRSKLEESGLETITLQADNYDLTESINYLKGMIRQCYGIIVVGFNQIYIEKGVKKRGAIERPEFFDSKEIDVSGQSLTSPFAILKARLDF